MRYRPGQIGECDHARREGIEDRMSAPPPPSQYGAPQYEAPPPHYGAPQYEAPPPHYGPPPGYPPPPARTSAYPVVNESHQGFGVVGAIFAVVGAILGVVALTAVNWFTQTGSDPRSHFGDVHRLLNEAGPFATGVSKLYFAWLAWALLAAAFVFAILAVLPTPASGPLRALGAIAALAGIGVTFWAGKLLTTSSPSYTEYLKHARLGFYFILGAFLLIGIGALIGPGRTTGPARY